MLTQSILRELGNIPTIKRPVGFTVNIKTYHQIQHDFEDASRVIEPRENYQITAIGGIEVVQLNFQTENVLVYYDQVLFDLIIGRKFPNQEWFDKWNKKVLGRRLKKL